MFFSVRGTERSRLADGVIVLRGGGDRRVAGLLQLAPLQGTVYSTRKQQHERSPGLLKRDDPLGRVGRPAYSPVAALAAAKAVALPWTFLLHG